MTDNIWSKPLGQAPLSSTARPARFGASRPICLVPAVSRGSSNRRGDASREPGYDRRQFDQKILVVKRHRWVPIDPTGFEPGNSRLPPAGLNRGYRQASRGLSQQVDPPISWGPSTRRNDVNSVLRYDRPHFDQNIPQSNAVYRYQPDPAF